MMLAIAHRGDPREAVENTVDAVLRAADLGADAIEVDLRVTADGAVVLHHDDDLTRLWGHPGAVAELTLAELRRIAPQVPTLEEALAALADRTGKRTIPLVLDVVSESIAMAGYSEAVRLGATGVVWFCGDPTALAQVRAKDDGIPLMFTWASVTPPDARLVDVVRPTHFNPYHVVLDEPTVDLWHRRGIKVSTWTVDDAARRELLAGWGVDAIISNDVPGVVTSASRCRRPHAPAH